MERAEIKVSIPLQSRLKMRVHQKVLIGIFFGLLHCLSVLSATAQSNEARLLFEQGVAENRNGKLIAASVLFTQAIAIQPDYADAYYERGLSFLGMGRKVQAMKDFQQAVGHKVRKLDPYLQLIRWNNDNYRYQATLIVTDQIIANMPENAAGAYWDKGQAYEKMNNNDLAIAAYEASLSALDSENSDFAQTLKSRIEKLK